MPIDLTCNACGQTLRVPDEHAGKQARCPKCQNVQPIPAASGGYSPGPAAPQLPVSPPGPPSSQYPFSPPGTPSSPPYPTSTGNPYADSPGAQNPCAPSSAGYAPYGVQPRSWSKPHQGTTILILGILSLVLCPLFGPIAWIMGQNDLAQIDRGVMDPSGRSSTQAGMILGIVGSVVMLLWCGCGFLGALGGG